MRPLLKMIGATLAFSACTGAAERSLYFGDLHIHTSYSMDAFVVGNRTGPADAYRYARGERIRHGAGYDIQIRRPLDFAAVTDHAEYLGVGPQLARRDSPLADTALAAAFASGEREQVLGAIRQILVSISSNTVIKGLQSSGVEADTWAALRDTAEAFYRPGEFTTFAGFEWGSVPDGASLHRNVLFRGSEVPQRAFGSFDSQNPEDLWTYMEQARAEGMQVLAIPHNANMSDGRMYGEVMFNGEPMNADYARRRALNEPVHEVVQIKGQSETHPVLSTEDEFADFALFARKVTAESSSTPSRISGSYAREAYRSGLELSVREGFNPYIFGMIGSSDSHNSSSPVEEDNYTGKLPLMDGLPEQRLGLVQAKDADAGLDNFYFSQGAAGLAAVWAEDNTRGAIFDAIQRREVYATTGTRLRLRVHAGWDESLDGFLDKAVADASGVVPMGGELNGAAPLAQAPRLAIVAERDPEGANLDRVQVIKLWVDAGGESHEQVIDVAWSGDRVVDPVTGDLPALSGTVDAARASYRNSVGEARLATLWSDPQFDPTRSAAYYVRVLEIPTPRWSTYDAREVGVAPRQPVAIQERAWSSPIWYRP